MDRLLQRIIEIRDARKWTDYRLAEESGLTQSTISAWFSRKNNVYPTISSLKQIAKAFGISMSYLFADGNIIEVTDHQLYVLNLWAKLNEAEEDAFTKLLEVITNPDA